MQTILTPQVTPLSAGPLPKHPAPYTQAILDAAPAMLAGRTRIVDTMAGTGRLFWLEPHLPGARLYASELQPRWAAYDPRTMVGNALDLPWPDGYFNGAFISPPYGNRFADKFNPTNPKGRRSYQICYGAQLEPDNIGLMQWGDEYRDLMARAWAELARILCPGGVFVLNISDHIRDGAQVPVTDWHVQTLTALGFVEVERKEIATPRYGMGANAKARVENEWLIKFVKGAKVQPAYYGLSMNTDWMTPDPIPTMARIMLGGIDLDPASCAQANERIKADHYWGPFDWGLRRPWVAPDGGPVRVFLNPPFGRYHGQSNLALWTDKLISEYDAGNVIEAVLVTTDALCDGWFKPIKDRFPICFPDGRLKFLDATGQPVGGNTKGTAIAYLGPYKEDFKLTFRKLGAVMTADW